MKPWLESRTHTRTGYTEFICFHQARADCTESCLFCPPEPQPLLIAGATPAAAALHGVPAALSPQPRTRPVLPSGAWHLRSPSLIASPKYWLMAAINSSFRHLMHSKTLITVKVIIGNWKLSYNLSFSRSK